MNGPGVAYDVEFEWGNSHGRLVELLSGRAQRGVVIDLGCGFAPHAEPLRDAGFTYVGFEVDAAAIEAVRRRGFDAEPLDLADTDALVDALDRVEAGHGAPVAGVIALDVIEHLVEPHRLLDALATWMASRPDVALGVSVPNVSFVDIPAKLLTGRWDVTPTGLLDHTHLRFFTDASLSSVMATAGFVETARNDRPADRSDQHWPTGSPVLQPTSRVGALIQRVRRSADDHSNTFQFVRLYESARCDGETSASLVAVRPPDPDVGLSVLAHPDMTDDDLDALRAALAAQTCADWQLITAADLGSVLPGPEGKSGSVLPGPEGKSGSVLPGPEGKSVSVLPGPEGKSAAKTLEAMATLVRGRRFVVVDRFQQLAPTWVAQFVEADTDVDATILRCAPAPDSPATWADTFDDVDHLLSDATPSAALAFPTEGIRTLRLGFGDGALPPVHSLLLDAARFCGVIDTGAAALAVDERWSAARADLDALGVRRGALDDGSYLMGAGTLAALVAQRASLAAAEARAAELERGIETLRADNRWLAAELRSTPVRVLRRILRRPRSAP